MVSRRRRCFGGPQALIVGAGKGSIAVWNILPVITVVPASVRGLPDVGSAGCLQGVKRDPGVRQGRKGRVAARMSVRVGIFGRSVCIARGGVVRCGTLTARIRVIRISAGRADRILGGIW